MWKKVSALTLALMVGVSLGFGGISEAHHHHGPVPGVDKPYNPPAYYSQTEVSWEDSPSTFALRDLARQGGNVYDYTRHLKSILYGTKFQAWLQQLLAKVGIQMKNTEIWPENTQQKTTEILEGMETSRNNSTAGLPDIQDPYQMLNQEILVNENADFGAFPLEQKYRYLHTSYLNIAQGSQDSLNNIRNILDAAKYGMDLSNSAEGDNQIMQAKNYLKGVKLNAYNELDDSLIRLTMLRALQQQKEEDDTTWDTIQHNAMVTRPPITYNNEQTYRDAERWSGFERTKVKTPDF